MTETNTTKSITVKILVIIGFIATIALLVWLAILGIKQLSPSFASLATVAESVRDYKPVDELTIETDKTVVNSNEQFQILWTDMEQAGEFKFTYTCEDGITILVRNDNGSSKPIQCTETLSLPATVNGLLLSINSVKSRFKDVEFSIAFVSSQKDITKASNMKITVVNTTVPVQQEVAGASTEDGAGGTSTETKPAQIPAPTPQPTYITVYPNSDANGYIDLAVKIIGTGEVRGGSFKFTGSLDSDNRNAIKFDIQNIGTKTSRVWTFAITLPSGVIYRPSMQVPLKPLEHAEFVLEFDVNDDDDFVKITIESETSIDSNSGNDRAVWHVAVDN